MKADLEVDPVRKKEIDNEKKYRATNTAGEKKLLKKIEDKVFPLLVPHKMREVHHPFYTQKNETLQQQATAIAPKEDHFLGGKMQLYDRLRLITIIDSVGELHGIARLFHSMGLPEMHPVLALCGPQTRIAFKQKT